MSETAANKAADNINRRRIAVLILLLRSSLQYVLPKTITDRDGCMFSPRVNSFHSRTNDLNLFR